LAAAIANREGHPRMTGIPFTEIVRNLPAQVPFVGPETIERRRGFTFRARLGANESPFGPSPAVLAALREAAPDVWCYPDAAGTELRAELARRFAVPEDCVLLGAGVDELLGNVVRMTVPPGGPVVTSDGAYPTFNYHVTGFGGELHFVPYRDDREDLDGLAAKAHEVGARLVYLANPDNPMGSWHDADAIQRFRRQLPAGSLLVLDEAYAEFAPPAAVPPLDPEDPGVIRLRTFSKVYGLAGLRIGYALAHPEVLAGITKICNHFGVNRLAQFAALAALDDTGYVTRLMQEVQAGKADYDRTARRLGFRALPSATNFVAIDVGSGARAEALLQALQDERVFVRMPGVAPLNRCIRVTVGPEAERRIFDEALEAAAARVG
jgi:histidinol-phosphate aminotransferase